MSPIPPQSSLQQVRQTADVVSDGSIEKTTIDWFYDELGRLNEARYDSFNNAHDSITRYAFDLASNRVKVTKDVGNALPASYTADETTDYLYDPNDRLTSESKDVTVAL